MIKRIVFTLLILTFTTAGQAWALLGPELSIGFRVGGAIFQEDEVGGIDTDLENANVLGLVAGVRQGPFGVELSVEWIVTDLDRTTNLGELKTVPVLLTAQYHPVPKILPIDPYLGIGIGYYINSFDSSTPTDFEVDDTVGFHISAGANLKITTALAVTVDARYAFADSNLDDKLTGKSDDIDLNAIVVTAGLKFMILD